MSCIFIAALTVLAALLTAEAKAQTDEAARQEPKEITIHLRGNEQMAAALQEAAAKGTTVTGIADFDSLSAVYELMRIHRDDGMSSGFYGHRFRLSFLSEKNVTAIVEGYRNLPFIKSAKAGKPVYLGNRIHALGGGHHVGRIPTKLVFGTLSGTAVTLVSAVLYDTYFEEEPKGGDDPWGGLDSVYYGLIAGCAGGFPLGVTAVDPYDSLPVTLLAGVIPGAVGVFLLGSGLDLNTGLLLAFVIPQFSALITSEIWRNPSEDHRTSLAIAPTPKGGLSGIATLQF